MNFYIKKGFFQDHWEFFLSLILFWVITIIFLIQILILNQGHLIYALDDAYIHLAIAKNFSQHGVWGVTKYEFSSSSSSLLYTLLLSLIFIFSGPNELVPFIINVVSANVLIYIFYYIMKKKNNIPSYATFVAILSMIFFLPIHSLVFIGMEHIIQTIINLLFIYIASEILSNEDPNRKKNFTTEEKLLIILASFVTLVRFEGIFIIITVSFVFMLKKAYKITILIIILGFLPIFIYGIISMYYGWFFLPNSVILKGRNLNSMKYHQLISIFDPQIILIYPHLQVLLGSTLIVLFIQCFKKKEIWTQTSILSFIFISITLFQLYFGVVGYIGIYQTRYDAHLVALGILLIFISIKNNIPPQLSIDYFKLYISKARSDLGKSFFQLFSISIIFILFFNPLYYRSSETLEIVPQATNNVYEQQYHMGLFIKRNYNGECIAANDIGAINFIADVECLDLKGLGDKDIARYKLNKDELDEDIVDYIVKKRNCKIAIIYEEEEGEGWDFKIPSEWIKVGEWTIEDNVVCYHETVSFWAIEADEVDNLIDHLQDFSKYLPNSVSESGNYTQ